MKYMITFFQPLGHVISIQNGNLSCPFESSSSHHFDIYPRNRQNGRGTIGGSTDHSEWLGILDIVGSTAGGNDGVAGELLVDRGIG